MTATLSTIQHSAKAQLAQSPLLQNNLPAGIALQQLLAQCYPATPYQPYNQRPDLITNLQKLPTQLGCSTNDLARLLILKLIAEFSIARLPLVLSGDISQNYQRSIQRIFQLWGFESAAARQQINDKFIKDIGLLAGSLLPCAERVVEPYSAIQRSLVYSNGAAQGWRFIRALVAASGNKPLCRLHVHLAEIDSLTATGWRLTCQQLAELLLLNPQLKGVVGASWFYDPALSKVSPKLAFISELLSEIQASWFFSHTETAQSGALIRSSKRQQAFANGQYQPRNYVIFITRKQLLSWHKRQML
ncbi:hypothetical protein WG68_02815 [Arsukibacterium ikkense]|uniref:Uncharacterized protein n=1 Tax=Arsukibacterium ikkense TaxID=336831 RepID=A0A0M2V7Q6_9GAMM|nr:hypothetical protein [Arsukibacterium ikkense]KKO46887.1 hypothetical protein WG68_02815 [Arsukibacterium ikkense]